MEQFLGDSEDEDGGGIPLQRDSTARALRKGWDKAELLPPDGETQAFEAEASYDLFIKILKILAYLISFGLTLAGAVVSKGILLLMTSQLKVGRQVPFCNGKKRNLEARIEILERIVWSWAILFAFAFPEILTFFRSLRIWMFKQTHRPTLLQFFIPVFFQTCHSLGLSLLVYIILPSMDVVRGAMFTNSLSLVPALFSLLSRRRVSESDNWLILSGMDGLSMVLMIAGLSVWAISKEGTEAWVLPLAALLVSAGWWENYVERGAIFKPMRFLGKLELTHNRYQTYLFLSLWKIVVFFGGLCLSFWVSGDNPSILFSDFYDSFYRHPIRFSEVRPLISNDSLPMITGDELYEQEHEGRSSPAAVHYAIVLQVLTALLAYLSGKFACKIGIQSFSFALALSLSVPVSLFTLVTFCGFREENVCYWQDLFPGYLFWDCPKGSFVQNFLIDQHGWVWVLWILAQAWTSIHVWSPKFKRLELGEILFVEPMYSSLLVDQSLLLNRRRIELPIYSNGEEEEEEENVKAYKELRSAEDPSLLEEDNIPKIYACATMWHEIKSEMKEMLKSVFRMDEDQAARRIGRKYFAVMDPDYYELETHIFFDDAFTKKSNAVNVYVKDLVESLEDAGNQVHETEIHLAPPKKFPTPYGGRLEWTLPGGTKLFVHLKDKTLIRHKKRWSQVMYMYYLLGHRLLEREIPVSRKERLAENTFILALDGDIDFKPGAVHLLVDLMRKNKNLGAACGRIHPIGSGLMVWYQKFEYAIGHWFQKATEHVIGCVLCSPGCFSLFRGKALLDKNVMAKYTTTATEPRHYVQYDQGEDRWLCTLLLQQGYRVEYSAASDALTHCPEQFGEFFTQRRRWVPSTMANIFDLLQDYKRTIRTNPDISYPYVGYQMMLMVGSILGPGTIFLMLIGAFNAAFRIPNFDCFLWNIVPVALFIFVCFFTESDTQLMVAQILSAGYALIMVAVVVALLMQIQDDGILAPSSLFLFLVAGSFVIAGILHPLEFDCLPHGLVYYITIPSMYLLLIIYSLMNLHVVSWGTREVVEEETPDKVVAVEIKEEQKNNGLLGFLNSKSGGKKEGSFELSFAGLFKLMCCTKPVEEKYELVQIASSLTDISKRLDSMERPSGSMLGEQRRFSSAAGLRMAESPFFQTIEEETVEEFEDKDSLHSEHPKILEQVEKRNYLVNPEWIDDPDLKDGQVDFLTGQELTFWREMMDKYLLPLMKDAKKEMKDTEELIELRNKSIFFFFMVNAVFVVAIFLLQNQKETIYITWPLGSTYNMTYSGGTLIYLQENSLHLEPIGVMFVGVFAIILSIQFICMLIHRFGTFSHILASTLIDFCSRDVEVVAKDMAFEKEGLAIIRTLQKLKKGQGEGKGRKSRTTVGDVARRKTIQALEERNQELHQRPANIETAFNLAFKELAQSPDKQDKLFRGEREARVTFQQLARRRSTLVDRRTSTMGERMRGSVGEEKWSQEPGGTSPINIKT